MRTRFERFCLRHRDKGIPNLMLYICIISAVVYLANLILGQNTIYSWLNFDKSLILQGQLWRLFTFMFTYAPGTNPFFILIGFYFFYNLGRHVELTMGTFKFNLFYFSGMVLMVVFAMIFCPTKPMILHGIYFTPEDIAVYIYGNIAWYMHLTLMLIFATTNPDSRFLVLYFIPVKAWFLSLVYLLLVALEIFGNSVLFPHNLFPLVAIANFLLFAGRDVLNLLPAAIRPSPYRQPKPKKAAKTEKAAPIPFSKTAPKEKAAYLHRCTICGRTDVSDPQLEFRYCSRCKGYFCYCEDHISNHTHVE